MSGAVICGGAGDFYPRSPCGERQQLSLAGGLELHFYPRSPCGERLFQLFRV